MLLVQEEDNGARMILRFRFFVLLLLIVAGWAGASALSDRLINLGFAAVYAVLNLLHFVVLRFAGPVNRHRFSFASVWIDLAFVISVNLYYWSVSSPGNFAFVLKNPLLVFILLPLVTSFMQFRRRVIVFASVSVLGAYAGLVGAGLLRGMPAGSGWTEHVLGQGAYLPALIITLPIFTIILSFMADYSVYRSVNMLERIGSAEAQSQMLSRYFSPDVVREITANPGTIMQGQRQRVTILFSDIRNFTAMSEGMAPDALAELLTEIRRIQIEAVFAHNGTVDKFIGDAIMATFGTPHPSAEPGLDAWNAVQTGWEMLERLKEFNRSREAAGLPPIRVGIGVHSGEAFAGNIGDLDHLEYTVIGDVVNTASRIESLCKPLEAVFLISAECYAETGSRVLVQRKPLVKVKGKETPVQVYEVTGLAPNSPG